MLKGWLLAMTILQGADAASSCVAFHRGFHEANPLMPHSCFGVVAVKSAAVGSAAAFALRHHPKIAKSIAMVGITSGGVAVTINLSRLR